ncbi:vesicle transport through interaction with t-SNAREs homolog 1A isoform X2 [Carcharodon carcharias]|uniref:vesicle transport through interaction with t-SNAREs homolog 1A isoform X2 n=1 Tax=Carcharodon carcharias TaxID=13397 RepID=UPI001B7DA488|nr:vesicle transport through interaction with t-SNAREs homolog 1A isoform X2 [Carcharodon carcharias]
MSSDFEVYEQDFGTLTAEITNKVGRIPKLSGDDKKCMVANVEKQMEEARELLEQMDLEVREIPLQSRGLFSTRMKSYKQELEKLDKDFKRSRIAYSDEVNLRNELLGDDGNTSENQRACLLDNTERLERSTRRLEAGYQLTVETEQIGQEILENLHHDKEKIQRARERLRETDTNLGKSSRILTGMLRRGWSYLKWRFTFPKTVVDHPEPDPHVYPGCHHSPNHCAGHLFCCHRPLIRLYSSVINNDKLLVQCN